MFYAGGVVGFLGLYGFLQEKIMSVPYGAGAGAEFFKDSLFLVAANRLVTTVYAAASVAIETLRETEVKQDDGDKDDAPVWKFGLVSISNVVATTCQYQALVFVSFPLQMLAKSFKMVPVMAWGVTISGKSYQLLDWLIAMAVTGGCMMFLICGDVRATQSKEAATGAAVYIGMALLFGYLAFDGFTSTYQEKLFTNHRRLSPATMMLYVNGISFLFSVIGLMYFGGMVADTEFIRRHPTLLIDVVALSISATLGQVFVLETIYSFGALSFAAVMNFRQLGSVLFSIFIYGHHVNGLQWAGVALCFGALFFKAYLGYTDNAKKHAAEQSPPDEQAEFEAEQIESGGGARTESRVSSGSHVSKRNGSQSAS